MYRKLKNFLFGTMPNPADATVFYNGAGSFTTPNGPVIYKVGVTIDGGGSVITTGVKGYSSIPASGTIVRARMLADQAGNCVIDVWKDVFASYPPVNADSITAAAPPTLTAQDHSEDTTLTGWTTTVAFGDVLGFNVDSASTVTRVTLEIWIQP